MPMLVCIVVLLWILGGVACSKAAPPSGWWSLAACLVWPGGAAVIAGTSVGKALTEPR